MNCSEWEERLALYAGGDLPLGDRDNVERHIGECAGCQVFLSGLAEALGTIQEAHAEPLAEAHFAAVRARVLSDLKRRNRRWAWALAVAAVIILAAMLPRHVGQVANLRRELAVASNVLPPAPKYAPSPKPADLKSAAGWQPAPRAKHHARHLRARPVPPAEPFVVKLLTDDPDVVIYWITDTRGDFE